VCEVINGGTDGKGNKRTWVGTGNSGGDENRDGGRKGEGDGKRGREMGGGGGGAMKTDRG